MLCPPTAQREGGGVKASGEASAKNESCFDIHLKLVL